jgi:HSP20 family protein
MVIELARRPQHTPPAAISMEIETMNHLTPFDPFADTGFDQLFRGFFKPVRVGTQATPVAIRMDVAENDKAYVVQAEIPGAKKEDIQVTIDGNLVTIGAEVKRQTETKNGKRALRSERYFGSVHRSFTLPVEVDEAASNARFENGVLHVELAKKAPAAGRKITIQ